jgi:hypothetical protein
MHSMAAPSPDLSRDAADAVRRERHMRALDRLISIGMQMAEEIGKQVLRGYLPGTAVLAPKRPYAYHTDLALALARVSRTVRMTVALQARMMDELAAPGAAPPRISEGSGSPAAKVGAPSNADDEDEDEAEGEAVAERREREGEPFDARPAAQIVDDICRRLDLEPALARSITSAFEDEGAQGDDAALEEAPAPPNRQTPPAPRRSAARRGLPDRDVGPDPPGASP